MAIDGGRPEADGSNSDAEFWQQLQIFPKAIADDEARGTYTKRAGDMLLRLRLGNLRHLSDRLKVSYSPDQELPQKFVHDLLQSEWCEQLIYLAAFLRPRVNSVVEFFGNHFDATTSRRIEASVKDKAKRSVESLKPFTKLVEIYLDGPANLRLIQFLFSWRKKKSFHEYEIEGELPAEAVARLETNAEGLVRKLNATKQGQSFELFGSARLQGGYQVFVLHRNYQAAVKPDHKSRYRMQHDYGRVVFGISPDRTRLIIKVPNRNIRMAIRDWVTETLDVKLNSGGHWFKDYDGGTAANLLTGEYDDKHGIDIVSMSFKYSSLPAGGLISFGAPEYSRSIKDEMRYLKKRGALRLSSLTDLASLSVRFQGTVAPIDVEAMGASAVTFRLNDVGLSEPYVEEIQAAFLKAFSLPLNRPIDPTLMATGATDIYHFLLSGVYESQVRKHHRDHLALLAKQGFLKETKVVFGGCTNTFCSRGGQQIQNPSGAECAACGQALKIEERKRYVHDPRRISARVRKLLQKATGWNLSATQKRFESHPFYQLEHPQSPNKVVCVLIGDRVTENRIEVFQRSMFPILFIHPAGGQRFPVVDVSGIAHLGFPYALSAQADDASKKGFRTACRNMLKELLEREQERLLGAARSSIGSLREKTADYDGRMFETDVYNVLRRLFLYSMKWGGASKADGFCSLNYYEKNDLGKPVRFNVSYDAKYSKTSYDFGAEEQRQMLDYILTTNNSKWLQTLGNRYDGHMIVTNSMEEAAMKNAVDFLWANHRLSKERPDFLVIFMRESFLTRSYELIHEHSAEMVKRWAMFPEFVVEWIKSSERGGFKLIDGKTAEDVVNHMLRLPPIDHPINLDMLLEDVTRLITQRTNVPHSLPSPSSN